MVSPIFLTFLALLFTLASANYGTGYARDINELASGELYNSTYTDKIMCGYQLSGNYCILNRVLYYALIIFSIIGYSHVWLIAGALASVLTYSGTAAVHAVILCVATRSGVFDIDIIGAWAIVSIACLTVMPIFTLIPQIRESVVSPIFGLWGTLVAIGAICSLVSIDRDFPDEAVCRSNGPNPQLLTSPAQLADPSFNCTYACFSNTQILRSPSEIIAMPVSLGFAHFPIWQAAAGLTGALGIYMAVFGFCMPGFRKSTEAELRETIKRNRASRTDIPKLRRQKANRRKEAYQELKTGEYDGPGRCMNCWSGFACVGAIVVIVLNEIFLLYYGGGFPYNEQPFAVGQWGPWVGVSLALLAAWLVRMREPSWRERQAVLAKEKKDFDERFEIQQQALSMNKTGQDGEENGNKGYLFDGAARLEMVRAAETGDAAAIQKYLDEIKAAAAKYIPLCLESASAIEGLVRAAGNGHLKVVRLFIENGVDIDAADGHGMTALIRAAWAGNQTIVYFLVLKGARVTDASGQKALSLARTNGHNEIANFLEARGATLKNPATRSLRANTE